MYSIVLAFGVSGIMLCLGMAIRAKVPFFRRMLMPASVLGGVIGFFVVNLLFVNVDLGGISTSDFSDIVDVFFVFSFISIGLTRTKKSSEPKKAKEPKEKGEKKSRKRPGSVRGAIGMALVWSALYAIQPLIGIAIVALIGGFFGMGLMYGILVPFAFCQGPGQASTYGSLFEYTYGYANAETVALTYAVLGFIAAFCIGVPIARYGLKKGLAKSGNAKINEAVERGYYKKEEQREPVGKTTSHSGNIETLAVHFAIMGVTYILAVVMAEAANQLPALGTTFGAMLFMWGIFAAYIVRWVMKKLKIDYLINDQLQSRISGFFSDFLVVSSFMAIQVGLIGTWLIPIIVISVVSALVTFFVCLYFGERLGSDHDFERVLGMYGTCTGTTPSGLSLIRIADPRLMTPAGTELGVMNMAMILSTPTVLIITIAGLGYISIPVACIGLVLTVILYLVVMKIMGVWGKPTFTLKKGKLMEGESDEEGVTYLKGYLRDGGTNDVFM